MKRIAVTGGNGLLGRYVVAALEPDYEITVIDRVQTGDRQPHGTVDVLDLAALGRALGGQDAVIHLAAIDAANDATPQKFFHTNVLAAWNVLHAGYESGVRRFALCSSSSAYGLRADGFRAAPQYLPLDESHPTRATDPYGLSKRACETVAEGFAARDGVSVAVLRPCSIAFPHMIGRMVADYENRTASESQEWKSPMPPLRWFVAPEDAATCFRLALEADTGFEVFNVSADQTFSAQPTLSLVESLFGEKPRLRDESRFEADPYASPMGTTKARHRLGWTPQVTWESLRARSKR